MFFGWVAFIFIGGISVSIRLALLNKQIPKFPCDLSLTAFYAPSYYIFSMTLEIVAFMLCCYIYMNEHLPLSHMERSGVRLHLGEQLQYITAYIGRLGCAFMSLIGWINGPELKWAIPHIIITYSAFLCLMIYTYPITSLSVGYYLWYSIIALIGIPIFRAIYVFLLFLSGNQPLTMESIKLISEQQPLWLVQMKGVGQWCAILLLGFAIQFRSSHLHELFVSPNK